MTRHAVRWAMLLGPLLLIGCGLHRSVSGSGPQPRYVIGDAYRAGNTWFYPREDFRLDATGLAVVLPDRPGLTANNEARDATALAAAHATLQLPAIARVTDLGTGRQILVRINDRGPGPGRLIGLTRHAADLLGIRPGAVTRVRMQVEDGPSQVLRDRLQGNVALVIAGAARVPVRSEALAPPAGFTQSPRVRRVAAIVPDLEARPTPEATPARLPEIVWRVPAVPGQLWLAAGEFGGLDDAGHVEARLSGLPVAVQRVRPGRTEAFRVRVGPFGTVEQADSALDRATRAGVTDAQIVVE